MIRQSQKINFNIAGVQKAGTSALDSYLRLHPEIEMGKHKELHFFDNEEYYSNIKINYKKLHFNFKFNKRICGEATPIHTYWTPSIKRIWEYIKKIKLIIALRNPIERAFSQWSMETNRNLEQKPFMHCIEHETGRCKESLPLQHRVYSYTDRGFYCEQIRRVYRYFNKNQVLFIKHEDFLTLQKESLIQIFQFFKCQSRRISI